MYSLIETGLRHRNNRDMVFLAVYCKEAQPYLKYDQIDPKDRGKQIPLVMMQLRWDGYIGFPGGKVDPGESLLEAVCRESSEEINFNPNPDRCKLLCSFTRGTQDRNIHCFEYPVSDTELREIMGNSMKSAHFLSETQGVIAAQVANFGPDKGFSQFRKNNFIATAGHELDFLIQKYGWLGLTTKF